MNGNQATVRGTRLTLWAILQFTIVYIPVYAIQVATTTQLPRFFASHLGIGLTAVGGAFAAVRLLDIWLDPALGVAMDRTHSPFGRYRPWLLASTPILMLSLFMLFNAPLGAGKYYLIGWLLLMYLGFSMASLSISAWGATLGRSYHERSRLFGVLIAMGIVGAITVLAIPVIMSKLGFSDAAGVQAMGWFIVGSLPIGVAIALSRTPEPLAAKGHRRVRLDDLGRLFLHRNVQRILIADFCLALGPSWMSALYLFFFKDSRGFSIAQANLLLMLYTMMGLVGGPATAWLSRRIGKHQAMMVASALYAFGVFLLVFVPKGAFFVAVPLMMVLGAFNAGTRGLIQALTGDLSDEVRLETGNDQNSLLFALVTATSKLGSGLSIFITFSLLAGIGYSAKEGAVNAPAQIHGLEILYIAGPVTAVLIGCACFVGYRLTAPRHAEILAALDARDRQPPPMLEA